MFQMRPLENANIMVAAIYDFVWSQRNDFGHRREEPPSATLEDVFVNLQVFPRYYQTAEDVRAFLATCELNRIGVAGRGPCRRTV
jgi:hypothetical protein